MATLKVIITSKKNLQAKYTNKFRDVEKLLLDLIQADSTRGITTRLIYIDDAASARRAGITAVASITRPLAKKAVDAIYKKWKPAYITLFGAQDVFPFQEITNPASDDDAQVPTDLPYACDAPYSTQISAFTGPTRVVGRIPDIPGVADLTYLKTVFAAIINYRSVAAAKLMQYFAVSADVWKNSTRMSLTNMFGNSTNMKISPPQNTPHTAAALKPLSHFYNCHGSPLDSKYYGQRGNSYPTAQHSPDLNGKVTNGTVVAAECCYGAELFNPADEGTNNLSIANTYFKNKAVAFTGSSTIAYGPASGNGLADLITQYFLKNVIQGASSGRALLEARQKFLSVSGPHLDPYELKTLAQFYLLGDPSLQVAVTAVDKQVDALDTVENRRLNLFNKGVNLSATIAPCKKMSVQPKKKAASPEVKQVLREAGFSGKEQEVVYKVKSGNRSVAAFAKGMTGKEEITFRTFVKKPKKVNGFSIFDVLVLKESGKAILGWRLYHRK